MFCYTSGTTGDPKAAMLNHNQMLNEVAGLKKAGINFTEDDICISYLPLAHSFEKALFSTELIDGISIGYFSGDPLKLLEDLQELKPTLFPSVPRLFNRIADKIKEGASK